MDELNREVGEIHTKVDHLIGLVEKQNGRVTKLEEKVGGLRRWQAAIMGVFMAAGTGLGSLLHKIGM